MLRRFREFFCDTSGNTAAMFGLALVPLCIAAGAGIDFARAVRVDAVIQNAADFAAIAAVADRKVDESQVTQIVLDYVKANGGTELAGGDGNITVGYERSSGKVQVTVDAAVPTTLMALASYKSVDVRGYAEALGGNSALDMVLVLDTTLSMNDDNKIADLKFAATNLIEEVFDNANEKTDIRIGIVPFSKYVNVGMGNRNASWMDVPDDSTIRRQGTNTYAGGKWDNCKSRQVPDYRDGMVIGQRTENYDCQWVPDGTTRNDDYDYNDVYKWQGCVGSRNGRDTVTTETNLTPYPGIMEYSNDLNSTARSCPQPLAELSSKKKDLVDYIKGLAPVGDTYLPSGVLWGWNVIDADAPIEFAAADAMDTNRAMLIMTDGMNSMRPVYPHHDGMWPPGTEATVANQKTLELCENVKATGVKVYTVAFKIDSPEVQTLMRDCASTPAYAYDADNRTELNAAFSEIAKAVAAVRLAK
jgi:Flp pilus assembly protein TadG